MLGCGECIKANGILHRGKFSIKINLNIADGEKVNIIGKNASGKTSLAYLLSGIIPNIKDGKFIGELKSNAILLLQNPSMQFFSLTVREELQNKKIAKRFGLMKLWNKNIFELSEGEKQLINLARILSSSNKALMLDEPFEFLDPSEKRKFRGIIENQKCTVLCFDKRRNFNWKSICLNGNYSPYSPKINFNNNFGKNVNTLKKKIFYAKGCAYYEDFYVDADIELYKGERIAIIGKNGSGKSLLLKAFAGIESFNGKLFKAERCFYLPQNPFLWPLHKEEMIERNARELGLGKIENINILSAAFRKLCCLAAIPKNSIMLLDEPTAWLDDEQKEKVFRALLRDSVLSSYPIKLES